MIEKSDQLAQMIEKSERLAQKRREMIEKSEQAEQIPNRMESQGNKVVEERVHQI